MITIAASSGGYKTSQQLTLTVSQGSATGIRINAGGPASGAFLADVDFTGGAVAATGKAIKTANVANAAPQSVYQSNRYQNATYTIPNLNRGQQYVVRLHFAEVYFTAARLRMFNVAINGAPVLTNFDIWATAGASYTAVVQQFTGVSFCDRHSRAHFWRTI